MSTNCSDSTVGGTCDEPRLVRVGVSEYAVADGSAVLSTSGLGSCLGVAVLDPSNEIAGLLHAMLPTAEGSHGVPAKFVDTGVSALVSEMEAAGADSGRMVAKIAGCSRMLDFSGEKGSIGERNTEATAAAFAEFDIEIVARDVGGNHGRSIRFEIDTGDLYVKTAYDGESVI